MLFSEKPDNLRKKRNAAQPRMTTIGYQQNPEEGDVSMKLFTPIIAACLLSAAGVAQAADANLGRNLAATCANCHGTDGKAIDGSGIDSLAGEDKAKLLKKLGDFKSGAKPASIMHQISKGYTDEQLALIAEYFAAQK